MKLEREQIQALNDGLNDVYDGYRRIVEFMNVFAKSGRFNPNTYTLELSENQRQEMSCSMLNELSKIEHAIQKLKKFLEDLEKVVKVEVLE